MESYFPFCRSYLIKEPLNVFASKEIEFTIDNYSLVNEK